MNLRLPLALAAVAAAGLGSCAPAPPRPSPFDPPRWQPATLPLSTELLAVHNAERRRLGAAPLVWDPAMAAAASRYAAILAASGTLRHSPRHDRRGQGENLWIGSAGTYPPAQMVGTWLAERRSFRPGRFPAVSRTGNWADVGHYTQMIWRGSTRLGCGLDRSTRWEVLVCRYAPAGNFDGVALP